MPGEGVKGSFAYTLCCREAIARGEETGVMLNDVSENKGRGGVGEKVERDKAKRGMRR